MPEIPMMARSTLNWRMKSTAASPTMPRSRGRTTPPATITSKLGLRHRMVATFRLLVITRRPWCCSRASAIASVVVPMLRISEQSSGTCWATARAMRALPSACRPWRCGWAMFSVVELGTRTPPWKRRRAPLSATFCTSRRTVCRVTDNCSASSSTVAEPRSRTTSMSLSCLGLKFTVRSLPVFEAATLKGKKRNALGENQNQKRKKRNNNRKVANIRSPCQRATTGSGTRDKQVERLRDAALIGRHWEESWGGDLAPPHESGLAKRRRDGAAGGDPGWQDQPDAHHGGPGHAEPGPCAGGWQGRDRHAGARARRVHGVPAVHQLPVDDGGAQHRVAPVAAQGARRRPACA